MDNVQRHSFPAGPSMPMAVQTAFFYLRPLQFVEACQRRYGDVFHLRVGGFGDVLYVADPEAIREVFAADGEAGHAGEANAILAPIVGESSLLTLDREEHLNERRLISPALHGSMLAAAQGEIARIAEEEERGWPVERPFALRPALQRVTFRVIAKVILEEEDPRVIDRLLALLEPVFNVSLMILPSFLRRELGGRTPWARFRRAREELDQELGRIIARRRAREPGSDLLSLIVHGADPERPRSNERARDELVTLLLAGHETSATALAWAFERLARNPRVLARARQAACEHDDRYLEALTNETLRVRPVIMDVGRTLDRPLPVAGHLLPAGTMVCPSIYLVHRDERHHPGAQEFRPERFLDARPDPSTLLPFGGGRRRCVGASLAMLEIRTVLQVVLSRRSVRAPDARDERPVLRGITFAPGREAFVELPRAQDSARAPALAAHAAG